MICLKYEAIKLGKKRMFLLLTALLLATNLFTIYISEKSSPEFVYIFEQKDHYKAFLAGDELADISGFYSQDSQAQDDYIRSYPEFITGMYERVERMGSVSVFSDPDSYVYRNMLRTCDDFKKFEGKNLEPDNCFGIRSFAGYQFGVLFTLTFLAVLAYYVIFYERDMNLTLLIKGTRRGHIPTAAAKLAVVLLAAIIYTLLQESLTFLMYGILYGYGDLSRLIQSVSVFRNCSYLLTAGGAVAVIILVRAAAALFFSCIFFCIGMFLKNESAAVLCSIGILALLFLFSRLFTINGTWGWLAGINPFYCWDMESVLGEYYNLDMAGFPVGKDVCTFWSWAVLVLILSIFGIAAYTRTCQIKSESRLEHLMRWVRWKTAFLSRRSSLLYYEFYKIMVQQKKGILFLILLAIGIHESSAVFDTQYYSKAEYAAYHYYLYQFGGRITDEVLDGISREEEYLNALSEELLSLGEDPAGADFLRQSVIQSELGKKEQGFYRVQRQIEALQNNPGNLYDKYLIDELGYQSLWNDVQGDISLWLAGSLVLLFFICGIRTMDEKRKMTGLLRSTRFGCRKLERSQAACAVWCTASVYLCMEIPLFLRYLQAGLYMTAGQKLSDYTLRSFSSGLPLGVFTAAVFILKFSAFLAICLIGMKLARMLKNELPALVAGAGISLIIAAVFYRMNMDIELILIQFL